MSDARADLVALFKRLHGMGVESAYISPSEAYYYANSGARVPQSDVLQVLGEMMTTDTGDITMGDVLAAAKRAGVF